jgi:hypothetical protein
VSVVIHHHNELIVRDVIRLIIPKLINAIKIPTTIKTIFFLASFTSAHLLDSIIHIIPLKITIVIASTIVILNKNLAILTISGGSVVTEAWNKLSFRSHHKIFSQKLLSPQSYQAVCVCSSISFFVNFCPLMSHHFHKSTSITTHSLNTSLPTAFLPFQRSIMVSCVIAGLKASSKRSPA